MKKWLYLFLLANGYLLASDKVDYAKEVQPILADHCYKCHYDEKQKGDFTFLTREQMLKGGKEGNDVIPGKSKDSLMIKLIQTKEADDRMPRKAPPLSKKDIKILKKWIDQGALMGESEVQAEKRSEDVNTQKKEENQKTEEKK